jgi:VWFA-related protein
MLAVGIAVGQAARQDPPPQQRQPVFRGGSAFVLVDVYPQQDGRVVEGLSAKDFQVFEDGKPQAIESFEFVRIEPSPEATRSDPNSQREALQEAANPSNRVFMIFLDRPHVTVAGSHIIRKPLIDMLDRIIAPNDLFGVMTPEMQPRHVALGRRMLSVEEQLTRHWPWGERHRLSTNPDDPKEDEISVCFGYGSALSRELIDRYREDQTLNGLESLAGFFAAVREARTVVIVITDGWRLYRPDTGLAEMAGGVSGGEPPGIVNRGGTIGIGGRRPDGMQDRAQCAQEGMRLAQMDNERRFREIISLANRSNVSFYPVTPAGLAVFDAPIQVSNPTLPMPGTIAQRSIRDPQDPTAALVENMTRVTARVDGLRTLAENTDGIAIVDTNDLSSGLRRIVDDVSAFYLLGYYSTNTRLDGRFRRIEVRTTRKNLRIKARRGYVAPVPPSEKDGRPSAAGRAAPAIPGDAFALLGRVRPGAAVFTSGVADPDALHVVVELARGRAGSAPRAVRLDVTSQNGTRLDATGTIQPPVRGTSIRIPTTGAAAGPWKIAVRVEDGAGVLQDELVIEPSARKLLLEARVFRATSSPRSPLWAAADPQFTRTERVHVEWRVRTTFDRRTARLLGRDGQPLAVPVAVTERDQDGSAVIAVDAGLSALTAGDYLIELVVGAGEVSETYHLPVRVTG